MMCSVTVGTRGQGFIRAALWQNNYWQTQTYSGQYGCYAYTHAKPILSLSWDVATHTLRRCETAASHPETRRLANTSNLFAEYHFKQYLKPSRYLTLTSCGYILVLVTLSSQQSWLFFPLSKDGTLFLQLCYAVIFGSEFFGVFWGHNILFFRSHCVICHSKDPNIFLTTFSLSVIKLIDHPQVSQVHFGTQTVHLHHLQKYLRIGLVCTPLACNLSHPADRLQPPEIKAGSMSHCWRLQVISRNSCFSRLASIHFSNVTFSQNSLCRFHNGIYIQMREAY